MPKICITKHGLFFARTLLNPSSRWFARRTQWLVCSEEELRRRGRRRRRRDHRSDSLSGTGSEERRRWRRDGGRSKKMVALASSSSFFMSWWWAAANSESTKKACVLERDGEGKGRFLCTRGQCTVDYKILEVFKNTQRSKLASAHTRILCGCIHVAHLDIYAHDQVILKFKPHV